MKKKHAIVLELIDGTETEAELEALADLVIASDDRTEDFLKHIADKEIRWFVKDMPRENQENKAKKYNVRFENAKPAARGNWSADLVGKPEDMFKFILKVLAPQIYTEKIDREYIIDEILYDFMEGADGTPMFEMFNEFDV